MNNELKETSGIPVDWSMFGGKYVKLEQGVELKLTLAYPRTEETEIRGTKKKCVAFDVLNINGTVYPPGQKILTVTSAKLIQQLRPLVEKYFPQPLRVRIKRMGEGYGTNYWVLEDK